MARSKAGEFAYQAVYRYLRELIAQVPLGGSVRLPSLRELAMRLRVSLATVQSAYALLEREGRVSSQPRSGYYVRGAVSPQVAVEPAVGQAAEPCLRAPHLTRALLHHERRLARLHVKEGGRCPSAPGYALRRVLAGWHARTGRLSWDAEQVQLASDVQGALLTALPALAMAGGVALIATPCCWQVLEGVRLAGLQVREIALDGPQPLDAPRLEQALADEDVCLVVLPSCLSVPGGAVLDSARQRALAAPLALAGVWVLEVDIDSDLCFGTAPDTRLREWIDPARLLVIGSLAHLLGEHVPYGYLLGGGAAVQRAFVRRGYALPPLSLEAAAVVLLRGDVQQYLARLRARLSSQLPALAETLRRRWPQLAVMPAAGGRHLLCEVRRPVDLGALGLAALGPGLVALAADPFPSQAMRPRCLLLGWQLDSLEGMQAAVDALGEVLALRQ